MLNMPKTNSQSGFTIIEVMIVVTIIGILAAIVLPNIRTNAARAKVSEALLAFGNCKNTVSELYMSGGDPPSAGNWGCEVDPGPVSAYVKSITTSNEGIITIELRGDPRLNLMEIALAPLDSTGNVVSGVGSSIKSWRCGNPGDLVPPANFALNPIFLPNSCRG
jgi:prepilin-type N-terminal cleavage/methylation domain-containing protein